MNRIYISLRDIPTTRLQLGFEGENDHTQVVFDSTALYISYPSAVASMTVKSPSGVLYPKELVKSGNRLIWNISASDCARAGSGQYQLTFTSGTEVIKTYIGSFSVDSSLLGSGDPPDPVEDWLQEAQEALDAFEQDVSDAEAWAVGTRDGDPVGSTDPAYHNNSKHYAEQAGSIEQTIESTGAAQVAAIEAKGEEVLESIPSDYTELSEDVDSLHAIKAPAIVSSASGAIASFSDGADNLPVKTLNVSIEPVQDLHGQDAPYPAGGGKNRFNEDTELGAIGSNGVPYASTGSIRSKTFSVCEGSTSYYIGATVAVYFYDSSETFIEVQYANNNVKTSPANAAYFKLGFYESYGTMYKYDTAVNYPSTVTTYSPYSNICPISGWTGANVSRTGKNLLDPIWETTTVKGVTFTKNADGTVTANGTASGGNAIYYLYGNVDINKLSFLVGKQVTFTCCPSGASTSTYFAYGWHVIDGIRSINEVGSGISFSFGYENASNITIQVADGYTVNNVVFKPQIVFGSTVYDFKPYAGNQISVDWEDEAGTVYGGTLTIHQDGSGELVVDRASVDLGSLTWEYNSGITAFGSTGINTTAKPYADSETPNAKCSYYKVMDYISGISNNANNCLCINTYSKVWLRDTAYTDATAFKTAVTGQTLVYELATPVTYQLTNQQAIALLKGVNNVWADTGNVTLEYPADTRLFIEKKISELQALILENISNS